MSLYAQDPPEANPGRPTIATPATLTPVGYLQFENGGLYATGSQEFLNQFSLNQVTKLTVHPRLQLLTNWQPFAYSNADRDHAVQSGDFVLGAQGVVVQGDETHPTVSLSYFARVYEGAAPDTDIGSFSQSALFLLSGDRFGFHADFNFFLTEQKDDDTGIRRAQTGQTISLSHNLTPKFDITGELWHFTQPLTHGNAVGNLWAVTYTPRPNLVFDAGFQHGLTTTSTQWEAFTGFTYLLPHRLWPEHRSQHR